MPYLSYLALVWDTFLVGVTRVDSPDRAIHSVLGHGVYVSIVRPAPTPAP